jgi:hypothetical protein
VKSEEMAQRVHGAMQLGAFLALGPS